MQEGLMQLMVERMLETVQSNSLYGMQPGE